MEPISLLQNIHTPAYIIDEAALTDNLCLLSEVASAASCKILLAQKAFSMYSLYPLCSRYLCGTAASGLYEARLGHDHFGGETHVFSPAYTDHDFDSLLSVADHIVFNSFSQWEKFGKRAISAGKICGIRVNPECSTQDHAIYDPCSPFSRLGVTLENFRPELLDGITGLHFHTLCEQNSDALETTLVVFEEKFSEFLPHMKWVNFGGGHHITRPGYDVDRLISLICRFREKYDLEVYIEPGEAVGLNSGYLAASVIDIIDNKMPIAILDTSAACHMPDILEMPYRPRIIDAGEPGEKQYTFRLGGPTCLAGDILGDYSFAKPLIVGDILFFCDMAIYTMVKNNTFNGIPLPDIAVLNTEGNLSTVRSFGYEDFRSRLS
jgi:carboxynorspermidine decarboxylase